MNPYLIVMMFISLTAISTLKVKPNSSTVQSIGISFDQSNALKSIACIYIVLGHLTKVVSPPEWFNVFGSFAWIDVGVFFFISGYGLAYGYNQKNQYFESYPTRIIKVLMPFLIAHLFYALAFLMVGIKYSFSDILSSLVGNSSLVRNDWYVPICILFYLSFWLVFRTSIKDKYKILLIFVVTCIYVFVLSKILHLGTYWWMNAFAFPGGVLFYYLGKQVENKIAKNIIWIMICFIGYVAAYIGVPLSNKLFNSYNYEVFYNLMSLFGVTLIVLIYSKVSKGNVFTKNLSAITYEMYLYHGLFIDIFRCDKLYITNDYLYVALVYVATVILSVVAHNLARLAQSKMNKQQGLKKIEKPV